MFLEIKKRALKNNEQVFGSLFEVEFVEEYESIEDVEAFYQKMKVKYPPLASAIEALTQTLGISKTMLKHCENREQGRIPESCPFTDKGKELIEQCDSMNSLLMTNLKKQMKGSADDQYAIIATLEFMREFNAMTREEMVGFRKRAA